MTPTDLRERPPQTAESLPWYRHGWVWLLIALPASSVVFGIVMITAATTGPTDLVRDDYYKAGLAINQDLDARARAADLGLEMTLVDRGPGGLLLRVDASGPTGGDAHETLLAELQHPTLAERDRQYRLEGVAFGRWAVAIDRFEGVRTLRIAPPDGSWVLQREVRAPEQGS